MEKLEFDEDGVVTQIIDIPDLVPFIRTRWNYNIREASLQSGLLCTDETRTQQQFVDECDINTIVERFGLTGELPQNLQVPMTGDFTEVTDYQTALNLLREADNAFMEMPAGIRERFGNDAGRFVDFTSDPANIDQVRAWGLARPLEPAREPIEVRVIPTPSEG